MKDKIMKRCCRCKIEKPMDCFTKSSISLDGLRWHCKECQKIITAKGPRYPVKIYMQNESKKCIKCNTIFVGVEVNNNFNKSNLNKDGLKGSCKKCMSIYKKEYLNIPDVKARLKLPDVRAKLNKYQAKYLKNRYHTDPIYYMDCKIRSTGSRMIKKLGSKKECKTDKYFGLNSKELYHYLQEEYFNRKGSYPNPSIAHDLDHIRPLYDFRNDPFTERMKACLFYNLRWLEAKENGPSGKWYYYRPEDRIIYEARKAAYDLQLLNGNVDPNKILLLGVVPYGK